MDTFTESVSAFLKEADWLGTIDHPAVTALKQIAAKLDEDGVSPSLVMAYGQTYRSLLKQRARTENDPSDDEAFLDTL